MPEPPQLSPSPPTPKYVDFLLYASAAITYIGLSIYNKWLLDWIIERADERIKADVLVGNDGLSRASRVVR